MSQSGRSVSQKGATSRGEVKSKPAKQDHNDPVTTDDFDREHMGIAAKE